MSKNALATSLWHLQKCWTLGEISLFHFLIVLVEVVAGQWPTLLLNKIWLSVSWYPIVGDCHKWVFIVQDKLTVRHFLTWPVLNLLYVFFFWSPFLLRIHISFDQVCFPSGDFEVPSYYFAVLDFKWQWGLNGPYIEAFVIGNYYSAFNS